MNRECAFGLSGRGRGGSRLPFGLFGMSLVNIFPANFQQLFPSKRVILDATELPITDANIIIVMPKEWCFRRRIRTL